MLEITLKQGLILRKALAPLTEIAEEATFKYSSEGIELIALNTDSILMGVLKFRSLDFQHFVCDTEGIGCFDLDLLYETLFFVDNMEDCSVTINYGLCEIGCPRLQFVFKNCTFGMYNWGFCWGSSCSIELRDGARQTLDECVTSIKHGLDTPL